MGDGGNVLAELTIEHREVAALFTRIETLPVGDRGRREVADELTTELVRHAVVEETHLYPAVRAYLEDGDTIADGEIADHAAVEKLLKDLEGLPADDPDFDDLVARLRLDVAGHVRDEENRVFPLLAAACTAEALNDLGDRVRRTRASAPARPRPSPPGAQPLTPGTGLVDRVRDLLVGHDRH